MYSTHPTLATRFSGRASRTLRSDEPLTEDQMRAAAPSIFAAGKHVSRSERYTYIPTIDVLRGLRKEGFEPFMVAQGSSRVEGKTEFTKHMIRMRHAGQVQTKPEANEIILINSHDGASSYQMLAGMFRFVCCNGLVVGDVVDDIRIPHKGNIQDEVIEGAFRVLDEFEKVATHAEAMKALQLEPPEEIAFATAALALRFGERVVEETGGHRPAPVTAQQLIQARRPEDAGHSLWTTFQRVQENVIRGGQPGRSAQGRRLHTRPVGSIDRGVSLNRALWMLAEEMHKIKAC
ncbi:hypothetical protein J2X20_000471 [Pelomonas saccharophila]|uniref:DUF945 domain-containing protein n=1 Tax=Roseateles saccharophilus TaxID=304 RepID=A0ABU1YG72_ROSSA|nr:DUF932 domain-containing protein [Roseateles saccharophilus]MDR7267842.1 hypothetical protein [Roseateles saccharophilus]